MRLTNKNLKKIINKVVNESMYVKRRAGEIESCFEDALESVDPMGYDDEFEYISDVIEETTKDFLELSDDIQRFSDEWYEFSLLIVKSVENVLEDASNDFEGFSFY